MSDRIKQVGRDNSYSTGESFSKEAQDEKENRIESMLKKNDRLFNNLQRGYFLMNHPSEPTWHGTAYMFDRAVEVLSRMAHGCRIEDEEDLAELFEEELGEAIEFQDPDELSDELRRSQKLNKPTIKMKQIMRKKGNKMRQFTNWVFDNTSLVKEGKKNTSRF